MTQTNTFLTTLTTNYKQYARALPWRMPERDGSFDAYKILVSEFMLQQTQVSRVIPKYQAFLIRFPTISALAEAPLSDVLLHWSGLGYNRRAKFLWQAAQQLHMLEQPWDFETLVTCPGIGPNTAAAIMAYSYDLPVVFIETNIRTVIIHHFFKMEQEVTDKAILAKLENVTAEAFVHLSPRIFYWALMDYGTYLKAKEGNLNQRSKTYRKQSKFHGSLRQIRGQVIKLLLAGPQSLTTLQSQINDARLDEVIAVLEREKLVMFQGKTLVLYNKTIKP